MNIAINENNNIMKIAIYEDSKIVISEDSNKRNKQVQGNVFN